MARRGGTSCAVLKNGSARIVVDDLVLCHGAWVRPPVSLTSQAVRRILVLPAMRLLSDGKHYQFAPDSGNCWRGAEGLPHGHRRLDGRKGPPRGLLLRRASRGAAGG